MSELLERTRVFALRCLRVTDAMPARPSHLFPTRPAVPRAQPQTTARLDALVPKLNSSQKLQITLEEADESHFWLGLAIEGGYVPRARLAPLLDEANELTAMLVSSLKTTKRVK